jgi:AcrR family transcriptional regulator
MSTTLQKWIEAGYAQFASHGPEGFHVEKLAKSLGLNKSGFYHHFSDRESFFEALMTFHSEENNRFLKDIILAKNFDPDYLNLVLKYKTAVFVQKQLRANSDIPLFREAFISVWKNNEKALLPLWAAHLKFPGNLSLSSELWSIFRDVFFMRARPEITNLVFLQSLLYEYTEILEILKRYIKKSDVVPTL